MTTPSPLKAATSYEYENDGNSASEYRVHDRQVIKRLNNSGGIVSSGAMDLEPALQARKTG